MMERPKIRAVEAFALNQDGQSMVGLRDPSGIAPQTIVLGTGAYFVVSQFDGANTIIDLQTAFSKRFGEILTREQIEELIEALDTAFFLESPALVQRINAVREEFAAASERPAALAGLCYEADPSRLRLELGAFFDPPEGPGRSPTTRVDKPLCGLISPHIDPRRGAAAYAHAYHELMRHEPPELVIILGTSHYGAGPELFSATKKNYATPLGAVETDGEFIDRLAAGYRGDLFADEILHRNEHSIEFQALFLAWTLGIRGYRVVPILVSSFFQMIATQTSPAREPRVASFLDSMRAALALESRRVLIIAGVDFAHVGRKFGDDFAADESVAERVNREDLATIEFVKGCNAEGFFSNLAAHRDSRRICGLAPMYTQLALLDGKRGRLLKYGIAMEPNTESAVSFASLAID